MNKNKIYTRKAVSMITFIHIIVWILLFTFPLLIENSTRGIQWEAYFKRLNMPVALFLIFYSNYLIFAPRFLLKKKVSRYVIYNLILIVSIMVIMQCWYIPFIQIENNLQDTMREISQHKERPPRWVFILKDAISFTFMAGLGGVIRMSMQWQKAENARKEAEQSKMEAELNNLRNQLNPHFLLNTLNNIYALVTFDTDKAQKAIQDLSKLLRHVLYENQGTFVSLSKEIDFIQNYIELMRIRLTDNVSVSINIQVDKNSQTQIAPLIFISLIENAFKHGISPVEPSFISINISENKNEVLCEIINSNHPKNYTDKSGSGIGLEQVKKRLELLYHGQYEWKKGINENGSIYSSILSIKTNNKYIES